MKLWNDIIDSNPKVSRISKKHAKTRDMYNINMVLSSPVSIYCIVWTIKNLFVNLYIRSAAGEDINKTLNQYVNMDLEERESIDYILACKIHEIMNVTLGEVGNTSSFSIDALVAQTLERFKERSL